MDIVERLKSFISYLNLQHSQFADSADIPRPSLSQIITGRNKKISNEFITKIHNAYPELNIMWLLFGDGVMLLRNKADNFSARTFQKSLFGDGSDRFGISEQALGVPETDSDNLGISQPQPNIRVNSQMKPEPDVSANEFPENMHQETRKLSQQHDYSESAETRQHIPDAVNDAFIINDMKPNLTTSNNNARPAEKDNRSGVQTEKITEGNSKNKFNGREIVSILVFYSDNSYEVYKTGNNSFPQIP